MRVYLSDVFRDDYGATAIEYGMIAALIAVAIIFVLTLTGQNLSSTFASIGDALRGVAQHNN
jgi:pilus assembly protein Flp/PilA